MEYLNRSRGDWLFMPTANCNHPPLSPRRPPLTMFLLVTKEVRSGVIVKSHRLTTYLPVVSQNSFS